MSAPDEFTTMLRDHVAPALRAMGFKGSGRGYRMDDAECWIQIGFQSFTWSTADAVEFTINLRVVSKAAWTAKRAEWTYLPAQPAPNLGYGPFEWFERIGTVMPAGHGGAWVLRAGDPAPPLAAEVVEAIRRYALPALEFERARAAVN